MCKNKNLNNVSNQIVGLFEYLKSSKLSKQRIIYFKLVIGLSVFLSSNLLKTQIENVIGLTKDPIIHIRLSALKTLLIVYQKLKVILFSRVIILRRLTKKEILKIKSEMSVEKWFLKLIMILLLLQNIFKQIII